MRFPQFLNVIGLGERHPYQLGYFSTPVVGGNRVLWNIALERLGVVPIEQRHSESMDIKSGVVYSWVVDLFILLSLGQ